MDRESPVLHHYELNAAIELNPRMGEGPTVLSLLHASGPTEAITWVTLRGTSPEQVTKCHVVVVPLQHSGGPIQLVAEIVTDQELDVFATIPDSFGKQDGIVCRLRDVIGAVETAPLRRMLSDAFSLRQVFRNFWTSPASRAHHHAYRGGLADHSIEIAENVLNTPRLDTTQRDLGVAYALLHDVGKVWCYAKNGRALDAMGHELVAIEKLHAAHETLATAWPDGAIALRGLLGGLWKQRGGRPILSVGKIVQGYDQASVERDLARRPKHQHTPWQAAPWANPVFDRVLSEA